MGQENKCPGGEHRQPSPSQDSYKFSLEVSPEERGPKTKINFLDFIKTKQNKTKNKMRQRLLHIEGIGNERKRQTMEWENIFAAATSNDGRVCK